MAVLLKTASVRIVSFKSCKLESKTRAKVFGKVDTLETYHPSPLAPLYTGAGGTPETTIDLFDLLAVCGAPLHHSPPR